MHNAEDLGFCAKIVGNPRSWQALLPRISLPSISMLSLVYFRNKKNLLELFWIYVEFITIILNLFCVEALVGAGIKI